ncbi:MAG: sugar phosphate isomerase/epimerase family protein [Candidatus Latescibacterota bacterium]
MARINAVSFHEHRSIEEICRLVKAAGFDSMEVSRIPFFDKLTTHGTRRRFREWAGELGLSLYGFDAWVEFDPYRSRAATVQGFARALAFAADLELGQVIAHDGFGPLWQGRRKAACLRTLVSLYQEVGAMAADHGLAVVLEPHPDTLSMDNQFAVDLIDGIGRDNVGLVYDSCHYGVGQPHTYVEAIGVLGRRIRHLHLSDGDCQTYALHLPLGEGRLDLDGIVGALRQIPFTGTLTNDLYGYPLIEEGARHNAPLLRQLERLLGDRSQP